MRRGNVLRTLAAGLIAAASLGATGSQAAKGDLTIGLNNWAENIAVSNMWKVLLEREGYDVNLRQATKQVVYVGVANGDLDMGLEVWMPTTDKPYYSKYEDRIALQEPWYRGTGLGLVVPSYVEADSIPDLKGNPERFEQGGGPAIVGIDPGSALMGLTEEAIDAYGLDAYKLIASSGASMTASLHTAIEERQPIVVTLWNPHWAFADYDLKYLDDPKNVFGKGENIHWMSRLDLKDDHPELVRWFNAWDMNDQQLGGLMATINEVGDPEDGAKKWIARHEDLVRSWMQ